MIKALVADDHAVVRAGLKQILAETFDVTVAGEASTGWEVLDKVSKTDCDVVLLDISMPGNDGLGVLTELRKRKPELPVLILTMYPEEQYAIRAFRGGAAGYVTKETASDELIAAIRKVVRGGRYVSSSLAEKMAFDLAADTLRPVHESLSDREYEVMTMIASGKSTRDMAERLMLTIWSLLMPLAPAATTSRHARSSSTV